MVIDSVVKLSKVQKDFNAVFPFLKIEFFKHMHGVNGLNHRKDMITADVLIKQRKKTNSPIVISEQMQVSALEQLFSEYFGISAQVFRKSGRAWLETSYTDDWTLKRQNDEGFELSKMA